MRHFVGATLTGAALGTLVAGPLGLAAGGVLGALVDMIRRKYGTPPPAPARPPPPAVAAHLPARLPPPPPAVHLRLIGLGKLAKAKPKPNAPPKLPTIAQLLAEKRAREANDARVRLLRATRPSPYSDVAPLGAWLREHGVTTEELRRLYPEWGWYRNHDSHRETVWRAEYKHDGGGFNWWLNVDGTWGAYHRTAGFDLFRSLDDVATAVYDAAKWLDNQLSHIDWNAIANDIKFVASFVPVLGTAVSDIVATVQVAIEDLTSNMSELGKALWAAYEYALSSIPGAAALQNVLDAVVKIVIELVTSPLASDVFDLASGRKKLDEKTLTDLVDAFPDLVPGEVKDAVASGKNAVQTIAHLNVGKLIIEAVANQVSEPARSVVSSLLVAGAKALGIAA